MRSFAFHHVDVFTERMFEGNQLAVFTEPGDLSDAEMQAIALEMNFAETVFVLPAVRDGSLARLRIFTPRRELAFAGHPTIGAVATLIADRGEIRESFTVDQGVGPVPIRVERRTGAPALVWLTTPRVELGATVSAGDAAATLGLGPDELLRGTMPRYASAGSAFLFVALRDVDAVDRAAYVPGTMPTSACREAVGVFLFTPSHARDEAPHAVYARMFAPWSGIPEDPATGSATGPLAAYMRHAGLLPADGDLRLVSEQGARMGRRSILHVRISAHANDEPRIEVGGATMPVARGMLTIPHHNGAQGER